MMSSQVTSGLIVIDKPTGITSHGVVAQIRRIVGTRKVGHAGTLDPMATGVLLIGVERATKLLGYLSATSKRYAATIRLGESRLTDDAEGEVVAVTDASEISREQIEATVKGFLGKIEQVPSAVSAVKIGGRRAYSRVRAGENVELAPRVVTITRFEVNSIRGIQESVVDFDVVVDCSSGTYIRALARDIGALLGVGGHLTALRRLRVGAFDISCALQLSELPEASQPVAISLAEAVATTFPSYYIDRESVRLLRHGVTLPAAGISEVYGVFGPGGEVVGLAKDETGRARSVVVFPSQID